jgi:hypothetical protein
MKFRKRILTTAAAVAGAGFAYTATPVLAEDPFQGVGAVSGLELAEERGMAVVVDDEALAKAVGVQHQWVTINGENVGPAGMINMAGETFAGQVMSTNVINSGNNSVFQVQNVIAVTVVDSTITP